ncbi:MAG TPA: GNAT family N-acetyltransferase [Pyrinomonadaceae bacterium]|nr:GNAT family N-acetyltransferase [Pyrinomonadaceae bacterium]
MKTVYKLMNIHVRALFTHNENSRLLFVNEPGGTTAPASRMFLGRTRAGNVWRFRADLPEALCEELAALCADEPVIKEFGEAPRYFERYARLLEQHAPVREPESGPAYCFTEYPMPSKFIVVVSEDNPEVLQNGFEDFISELPTWQPFVALIENNRAASVCRSVRITPEAHEAGVETLPDFRGKGFAVEVTAEWARLVRASGALPLYSTAWENAASQAVARKLNLKCYGADFHIA